MTDLEKIEHRIAELEQRVEQLEGIIDFNEITEELKACQPVPEPEQRWRVDGDSIYCGYGAHNRMNNKRIADLLNAHGITPDTPPIDKARGRKLVEKYRELDGNKAYWARQMRDWIAEVCGE